MASKNKYLKVVPLEEYKQLDERMHRYFDRCFHQSWLIQAVLNLDDDELKDLYYLILNSNYGYGGKDDDDDVPFPDEV